LSTQVLTTAPNILGLYPFVFDYGGTRATRYAGAVVQGGISFVAPEGILDEESFSYRIDPPDSLMATLHNSSGEVGDNRPEDAPFREVLGKSLAPAMARVMAENFGEDNPG
jgi:hypothetical protein